MSNKAIVVAFAILALAPAAFAAAGDEKVRSAPEANTVSASSESDLKPLFESTPDVIVMPNGMMVAQAPMHLVMLVRIAPDGSIVTSCVDSAESAARFLHPKSRTPDVPRARE